MGQKPTVGFDKTAQEIHKELTGIINQATENPTMKETLLQADIGSDSVPNTMPAPETTATIMIDGLLFPQRTRLFAQDLEDALWRELTKSQKQNYRTRIRNHKSNWET
eukprot:8464969-Prorocentrum_lima.AAC.1